MASSSYEEVCNDLYNQIHDKLERRDITDRRFARIGTTEAVLSPSNLKRFFCSLVPQGSSLEKLFGNGITVDVLVSRIEERSLHNFLATLVYAHCSIESARNFARKLLTCLDNHGWPIYYEGQTRIDQLPAEPGQLEQIFGIENQLDITRFDDTQSCFCPVVLYEGEDVRLADSKKQRLPYMSEEEYIDRGSYGMVYRVVIAKGHLANRHTSMANAEPVTMARKDFKKICDFQKEYEVIKHILRADRKSKHIVETFGSLQLGETTFSLFMAHAKCDLGVWMRNNAPPVLESEKSDILKCASGLADGLEFLHSDIRDPDGVRMVCYHMDLKPANILVFLDSEGKMLWKISDFGMSRVKVSHHHMISGDRDISAIFEKREEGTSVSPTVNRRFEGSYLAPESDKSIRGMNEKSDIWSLGCVISVVMIYLAEGQNGVDEYANDRADTSLQYTRMDTDRFFLVSRSPARPKAHPTIRKTHKRLILEAARRSPGEGNVVERILRYTEEKVLHLDPRRRESAKSVSNRLLDASAAYRKLSENSRYREGFIAGRTTPRNAFSRFWQGTFHRQKPDGPKIETWMVPHARPFAGCSMALNEFVVAYWTDTDISLYNSQSFPPYPHREIKFVAECRLKAIGAWKSVRLNETYLIASTTGHHCHVYLFDIKGGNLPGLSFDLSYDVVLPVNSSTGLHQIAISPGGKVLACVVRRDTNRSWVYYADIDRLISHRFQRRNSETTLSSNSDLQYRIDAQEPWDAFRVDASASSVTHLLFLSDKTLCCVAQPDITERHDIKISCLSLSTRTVKELCVENRHNSSPREFDSSNQGRLFTELTAITEQVLAIVLYENQLFIQNFGDASLIPNRNITFPNYFIIRLLMDEQHSRLFALGTKSGNGLMLLMELPLSQPGDKGKPHEIAELPNIRHRDKFTVGLFNPTRRPSRGSGESSGMNGNDVDGGCYIVISVYAVPTPTLYKINLPKPL